MLFCGLLLAFESSSASVEGWVFLEKDRGVTLHSRRVAGYAESEFKGSLVIHQPIEVIGAVLTDIASYTDWFFSCVQAIKIPRKGSTNQDFLLYVVADPPWPIWKRDVVYHASTQIDFSSGIVMIHGKALRNASTELH